VVFKSEVSFTCLFTDQALEQEIRGLKRHGGIVGLSQDEAALDRLVAITPHLARIVQGYLSGFSERYELSKLNKHYQLAGNVASRTRSNDLKLNTSTFDMISFDNEIQRGSPRTSTSFTVTLFRSATSARSAR